MEMLDSSARRAPFGTDAQPPSVDLAAYRPLHHPTASLCFSLHKRGNVKKHQRSEQGHFKKPGQGFKQLHMTMPDVL
jgi:hypothetical protein